ncbi:hypothetical protein JOB18_004359, partial [Solea senegalensis]
NLKGWMTDRPPYNLKDKVSGRSQNRGSLDWNAEIFHPPVVAGRTALRPEPGAGTAVHLGPSSTLDCDHVERSPSKESRVAFRFNSALNRIWIFFFF